MPNVNVPENFFFILIWIHQEKRRRQPVKKNYGHGRTREGEKGAAWTEMDRQQPGRYEQILNDRWHDWKQTVLENCGEDWHAKVWRWYLTVRKCTVMDDDFASKQSHRWCKLPFALVTFLNEIKVGAIRATIVFFKHCPFIVHMHCSISIIVPFVHYDIVG